MIPVTSASNSVISRIAAPHRIQEAGVQDRHPPLMVGNHPGSAAGGLLQDNLALARLRLETAERGLEEHLSNLPAAEGQHLHVPCEAELRLTREVVCARNQMKIAASMLSVHNDRDRLVSGL